MFMRQSSAELQSDMCRSLLTKLAKPANFHPYNVDGLLIKTIKAECAADLCIPLRSQLVTLVFGKQIDEQDPTAFPVANYRQPLDHKPSITDVHGGHMMHIETRDVFNRTYEDIETMGFWSLTVFPTSGGNYAAAAAESEADKMYAHRAAALKFSKLLPSLTLISSLASFKGTPWVARNGVVIKPGAELPHKRHGSFQGWWTRP